jgi:tetratricopeptide (TPR) repeat protein
VRIRLLIACLALLTAISTAQDSSGQAAKDKTASDAASSDQSVSDQAVAAARQAEESSSHDTRIDISPPKDDDKNHPGSKSAVDSLEITPGEDNTGVQEFHPWSPMKALKNIEVGDFYFKRKNYKAALERYKGALDFKPGDAVATFRVAECEEKLGDKTDAKEFYEQYLKILPEGPYAKDARASLVRLAKAQ